MPSHPCLLMKLCLGGYRGDHRCTVSPSPLAPHPPSVLIPHLPPRPASPPPDRPQPTPSSASGPSRPSSSPSPRARRPRACPPGGGGGGGTQPCLLTLCLRGLHACRLDAVASLGLPIHITEFSLGSYWSSDMVGGGVGGSTGGGLRRVIMACAGRGAPGAADGTGRGCDGLHC